MSAGARLIGATMRSTRDGRAVSDTGLVTRHQAATAATANTAASTPTAAMPRTNQSAWVPTSKS